MILDRQRVHELAIETDAHARTLERCQDPIKSAAAPSQPSARAVEGAAGHERERDLARGLDARLIAATDDQREAIRGAERIDKRRNVGFVSKRLESQNQTYGGNERFEERENRGGFAGAIDVFQPFFDRPPDFRLGHAPQHFLNFFPLPHGHGSLRPIFCTWGVAATAAAALPKTGPPEPSDFAPDEPDDGRSPGCGADAITERGRGLGRADGCAGAT
jgi:hypothetical protein